MHSLVRPSLAWLAARVGIWLLWLPIRLRTRALPELLGVPLVDTRRVTSIEERDRIVRVVQRVCRLPIFRASMFPGPCLREALALHYVLTRIGYQPRLHIGVRKDAGILRAHSWVTWEGQPVAGAPDIAQLRPLYSSRPPVRRIPFTEEEP